jgi:signal recognition particle subunit SRP54
LRQALGGGQDACRLRRPAPHGVEPVAAVVRPRRCTSPEQPDHSGQHGQADMDRAERDVRRMEGIICSMTPLERRKPELLKATRKRRVAVGSGVQVQDVNRLLKQFEQMRDMMKKMKGGGMMKMMKRMGAMKGMGGPGGMR